MSVRIRTAKSTRWGKTIGTDIGNVVIDAEGFCEVETEEDALSLIAVGFEVIDAKLDAQLKQEKLDAAKKVAADKKAAREAEEKAEEERIAKLEEESKLANEKKEAAPIKGAEAVEVNTTDEANGGEVLVEGEDSESDGKVDLNEMSFAKLKNTCIAMEYPEEEWKMHKSKAALATYLEKKLED